MTDPDPDPTDDTDDDPKPGYFDYGEKRDDGQYENHPTIDHGEFVQPVRHSYVHADCGTTTTMPTAIAESVARDPHYYTKTFCAGCGDYYPTDEVHWPDGQPWASAETEDDQ